MVSDSAPSLRVSTLTLLRCLEAVSFTHRRPVGGVVMLNVVACGSKGVLAHIDDYRRDR
jgi:hypothetical protein